MKIFSKVDKKYHKDIKKNAKRVGLDLIGPEWFRLYKTGVKSLNYKMDDYVDQGEVSLVGNDEHVWIVVNNHGSWFKTSPVLECTKTRAGFDIETLNSFYRLEKCD
jgi:hypothetical protein